MSTQDFEIDPLEERIAPSSLSLGSIADNALANANASNAFSGDSIGSNNDPSITGNSVDALSGNSVSTGPVTLSISL